MASTAEEDGSKCPICFEIYKNPKALVCLHTFCEICIHEYVIKSQEKGLLCNGIECPLCRFVTPVDDNTSPETWAKGLRPNFALGSLLDSARINLESLKQEENKCQRCSLQNISNPASVFCSVCSENMCGKCKNVHDSFQFMKNHKPVDIGSKEHDGFSTTLRTYQKCEQHGKKIKFYCKDDDTLCCSTCAIVGHRACKGLIEISAMAQERQSQLQWCLLKKQMVELENFMKMSSSHFVTENKQLITQGTDLLTEWNQVRANVNKKLDQFEDMLKEDVKTLQITKASDMMVKAVQCNEIEGEMRHFSRILRLSEENSTKDQQYVVMKKVLDEFNIRQSKTAQTFADMKSSKLSLVLSQPINELLNLSSKGVSVTTESVTKFIPKCSAKTLSLLAETNIEKTSGDKDYPLYTGLGFLKDGRIVAVDREHNKFVIMDKNLNKIAEKCLPNIPGQSLAVTRDDQVVITTGSQKKLCFYKVDEDNTINEKEIIPVDYKCSSISLVNENKCVVGTYGTGVEPAHLLTFDGDFFRLKCDFGGMSFKDSNCFQSLYNEESMQLLVTEGERNTVHVYNIKQTQYIKIEDDNIVDPEGIAHYMNDLYFVCSHSTNSIIQLSSRGQVLKCDVLNNMEGPYSICISPDKDQIVVSNNIVGGTKLLLFKIQ